LAAEPLKHGVGFRPRLAPTLVTILIVVVCAGLGVWQIQRLHWKEGLIAERAAALDAAPVAPPQTLTEARALEFHRVIADGVFLNDKELLLNAIGPKGGAGFDVLTPLREAGGHVVFVNRGYIPTELKDPARRAAGEPTGQVHIAGLLRLAPDNKPNWFVPDNRPDRGDWFWVDLNAMAAADGLHDVAPYYIAADATANPGGWPKGGVSLSALPNHHLQYAITWFSLAGAAIVIYLLSERRAAGGDDRDDARRDDRLSGT
jgi:surfeit locus 1 family protein